MSKLCHTKIADRSQNLHQYLYGFYQHKYFTLQGPCTCCLDTILHT